MRLRGFYTDIDQLDKDECDVILRRGDCSDSERKKLQERIAYLACNPKVEQKHSSKPEDCINRKDKDENKLSINENVPKRPKTSTTSNDDKNTSGVRTTNVDGNKPAGNGFVKFLTFVLVWLIIVVLIAAFAYEINWFYWILVCGLLGKGIEKLNKK